MTAPASTHCIEITAPGNPDALQMTTRALPSPGDQQVIIQVCAAGVNRPDIFQRQGLYPAPQGETDIPGLEVSGTIVATGAAVTKWQTGDQVCALLPGGGYSRYALAHQHLCLPIPKGVPLLHAAGLPEVLFTVWFNLVEKGQLRSGNVVLTHGGSSGIGTTAIQVARAFGATVYATAGSDNKCRICENLGAAKAFNYNSEDFTDIKALTGGHGADIIIDMVGGDYVQKNIKAAAHKGRIISLAFLNGSRIDVDLMPMMLKQLVLTGSTLRSQPVTEKSRIAAELLNNLWPLIETGQIKPVIDCVMPLENAAQAHRLMESSKHVGKILLDCRQ